MVLNNNITSNGFLSGFIESSVEMPVDGSNGECIVHYAGEHSKYEMIVRLVDGKREGEAMIVNDGMPYLKLHFERGSLTGVVERLNESGSVELRGHLVNGIESGFFKEYDNDKVVWIGYYRNGERYSEVRSRVANQDDDSGEFYELDENGGVTQLCLYVNGEMSRVIQKFSGEVMTELDESERRVYEGGFYGDMDNGYVREGKGKEFVKGGREAVYYGDWKNGNRDGMGTEFKGFRAVYTGEWKDGKRNGEGEEMDERGNMVEGIWCNGIRVITTVVSSSLASNPQTIEELKIDANSFNDSSVTELKLSGLVRLKRIVIGDECFGSVRVFELDGLSGLESVVIGNKSFIIGGSERSDGTCRIMNCPKLKSIQIGDWSFADYHSFELNNLPSLQSIEIGSHFFYDTSSFSLTGLID